MKNQIFASVISGIILFSILQAFKAAQKSPAQTAGYWV
jgi:hypothetical protein